MNRMLRATGMALAGGFSTAVWTFRRINDNPSEMEGGLSRENRAPYYLTLWSYYDNSAFEDLLRWGPYKAQYKLYRQVRSLYNPTRRLVDFYASQVYPGVLTEDAKRLPDGVPMAIPLADDTPPQLRAAIAQLWKWSNWQSQKSVLVRYGAVTGNVLVELDDDLDQQRVTARVLWPGLVAGLDLDSAGNVKAYVLQYLAVDNNGFRYVYRKEVFDDQIITYKDGEPFDYDGSGAVRDNPYGFCPAVWIKHSDIGGNFGAPAMAGSLNKVDELNSLAAHVHDQVHKAIAAPQVIASAGRLTRILQNQQKRLGENDWSDPPDSDREAVLLFSAPYETKVESLAGDLNIKDALALMQNIQTEIEADHPELAMYRELRAMSQITGPAAERVMGDVSYRVGEAAANYDRGMVALLRMATAIAGWRLHNGDWTGTPVQYLFAPFDLESLHDGSLDFDIMPRRLIVPTELEQLQIERQKMALQVDQKAATLDPAQIQQQLETAAESAMVRTVIPRTSADSTRE